MNAEINDYILLPWLFPPMVELLSKYEWWLLRLGGSISERKGETIDAEEFMSDGLWPPYFSNLPKNWIFTDKKVWWATNVDKEDKNWNRNKKLTNNWGMEFEEIKK